MELKNQSKRVLHHCTNESYYRFPLKHVSHQGGKSASTVVSAPFLIISFVVISAGSQ